MNILLTCAGRRSYLVEYFKEVLEGNGRVYTTNSSADAAAMVLSDGAFVAPSLYSNEYPDFLEAVCLAHDINLVVSLFDLELPILAKNRKRLELTGAKVAVSDIKVIDICNDKLRTSEFIKGLGLDTLFTTTDVEHALEEVGKNNIQFPLYIKPRWGMGSIATLRVENEQELRSVFGKVYKDIFSSYLKFYDSFIGEQSVIVQEVAKGVEYGLDVVNDFDGNYITTFVKRKLEMRSGETDSAITEDVPQLRELGKMIGVGLGHIGNLDVDVFWDGKNPVVLEMNARFGGGYPFSHLAGANIPKAYIAWQRKEVASKECFGIQYGVKGLKDLRIINSDKIKLM